MPPRQVHCQASLPLHHIAPLSFPSESRAGKTEAMPQITDETFMQQALALAARAQEEGEVPVGALVVIDGQVIGEGWNRPIAASDPTAHAEIQAIRAAASQLKNYRLSGATLYVTLEPCDMCVGAMFHARIARCVFGAKDPKKQVLKNLVKLEGGILAPESGALLTEFFTSRR